MILAGGHVYDVDAGAFTRLDVGVGEGLIHELGPAGSLRKGDVVSVDGLYLLPGLIDCHVHLSLESQKGDPAEAAARSDDAVAAYMAESAERTVLAGITTVRDVGGWNFLEMDLRARIERGELVGPRLFLSGRLLSVPTPAATYYPGMYELVDGPRQVIEGVRRQVRAGADLIKVMATGAMLSPQEEDAGAAQLSLEELTAAVTAAASAGLPVAAHGHADEGIRRAVESGVASIEHGTFASEATLRGMAARGTFLVPTFGPAVGAMDPALIGTVPPHVKARLASSRRTHAGMVEAAHAAGVPIAMGTDAGTLGTHHGRNAQECSRMVVEAGMSPQDAIRSATVNAAQLLGQANRLGRIRPGMLADLIALDADPLEDMAALLSPAVVMSRGRLLVGPDPISTGTSAKTLGGPDGRPTR